MERKIGEIFKLRGVKLEVIESNDDCFGCAFCLNFPECNNTLMGVTGHCSHSKRSDRKDIIFKEV